jgi:hypothetical protein
MVQKGDAIPLLRHTVAELTSLALLWLM